MNVQLPPKCFISHAYADAIPRDGLIKSLPSDVEAIVFPPITVPPDQFVSNRLIESLLSCDGLIYLTGGASDSSFWVAFEHDYALRAGKQVFSADVHTLKITKHTGNALELAVFASYHRQDRARVREVADFLNRERYFDLWLDVPNIQVGANWQEEILIDEPKFGTSIRQQPEVIGDILYFRAHGRNAKKWWHAKESWERYDYLYSRPEIKQHAKQIKAAASTPGVKKALAFYNNHSRANAPANAIMLSQELGVRLKGMPSEAMVTKFPDLVQGAESANPTSA
jgi:Protein of unknown function DUF72